MSEDKWQAGPDVQNLLTQVMKEISVDNIPFGNLDYETDIKVVFQEKLPPKWGMVPGNVRKASKDLYILHKDKTKFIFEVHGSTWQFHMTPHQRKALLYHLCSRIVAKEDENEGTVKYSLRSPPVQSFPDELQKFGLWWPTTENSENNVDNEAMRELAD